MQWKVGAGTDIGRRRSQNQDSYAAFPEIGLFIVADGMGGHQGGETASKTAVKAISGYIQEKIQSRKTPHPEALLKEAITHANSRIFELAQSDRSLEGMGTTTVVLYLLENTLWIGHVGDSRCYLIHPQAIWQLTRDHSLVQEKLRAGLITRDQVKTDQMKNVITRSVGYEKKVEVEVYQMSIHSGACLLMCSDGLSGLIEDSDILRIVNERAFRENDQQLAVKELLDRANQQGGDDNITSILVQVV